MYYVFSSPPATARSRSRLSQVKGEIQVSHDVGDLYSLMATLAAYPLDEATLHLHRLKHHS